MKTILTEPTIPQNSPNVVLKATDASPRVSEENGLTLEKAMESFLRALDGKNRSHATIRAYTTDTSQFIAWLHENNFIIKSPAEVEKVDICEYLAFLGDNGVTGVSRARKLAAIREYFRFLEGHGHITKSPAGSVETPKKEKNSRTFLHSDEYNRMLSLAGGNPRDYAILHVFLQTGVQSE